MRNKFKYLVLMLFIFLIGIVSVSAKTCTIEEIGELKNRAGEITSTYDLIENPSYYYFAMDFYNLDPSLYFVEINNPSQHFKAVDETNSLRIPNLTIDRVTKNIFEVYAADQECTTEVLRNIEITLPRYNVYSDTPICNEFPDHVLCKELLMTDESISFSELEQEIKVYKENLDKENPDIIKLVTNSWILFAFLGFIIVVALIYYFIKR